MIFFRLGFLKSGAELRSRTEHSIFSFFQSKILVFFCFWLLPFSKKKNQGIAMPLCLPPERSHAIAQALLFKKKRQGLFLKSPGLHCQPCLPTAWLARQHPRPQSGVVRRSNAEQSGKRNSPSKSGGKNFLVKNKNYVPKKQTNCIFILSLSVFFSFFFEKRFSKIRWKIEKFIDPLYSFFALLCICICASPL